MDEVLNLWSGLGYYARGRNLHRTARIIIDEHKGIFPDNIDDVINLPGIGPSTAGAILALSQNQHHAILDGNVKRVLSRFAAIDGWPGKTAIQKQLWQLAKGYTPRQRVAEYTQAIMDLGATLCTRSRPACTRCPMQDHCQAYIQQRVPDFPNPKPRKTIPVKKIQMLILHNEHNHVLLQKRPPSGIWGGLWSLPEYSNEQCKDISHWAQQQLGYAITAISTELAVRHTFSHFHLDITPVRAQLNHTVRVMDDKQSLWYNPDNPESLGMAAPIKKLLHNISTRNNTNEGINT